MDGWGISTMKNKRTTLTIFLIGISVVLLGSIFYISSLLSSSSSPTKIQKTKASAVTYKRTVDLAPFGTETPVPTEPEKLISQQPTSIPTILPSIVPSLAPTMIPTVAPTLIPTSIPATPTLSPLLAYKSTGGVTPTLIPLKETGGMTDPTKAPSPTKKSVPTGAQELPQTGWIQTSTILFIVASSTILFSLLF